MMNHLGRQILRAIRRRCEEERGVALIIVAGSMVALTSAVALAVDVGMLTATRTEAQRVADAAAMAGAGGLILFPTTEGPARASAIDNAALNTIRGAPAVVLEKDVDVNLAANEVTVQVLRTEERGNPIGTFFARIFGVNTVDISAVATAWAAPAAGVNCLLPIALPDKWHEAGGPGNNPDAFDPDHGDFYVPWMVPGSDPAQYNDNPTGYTEGDVGKKIVIKSNTGPGDFNENWYFGWRPGEDTGAEDWTVNIYTCVDPDLVFGIGSVVNTESGLMNGPTVAAFEQLINQDPSAVWNQGLECITDSQNEFETDASYCRSSPRIRPVPLFDPRDGPDNGTKPFAFSNFAGLFVEAINGNQIEARWIGYTGLKPADPGASVPTTSQMPQVVQLID